jgi:hypothetical protein
VEDKLDNMLTVSNMSIIKIITKYHIC